MPRKQLFETKHAAFPAILALLPSVLKTMSPGTRSTLQILTVEKSLMVQNFAKSELTKLKGQN